MASKEQVQAALDELWTKYGNTLSLLSDSVDKIEEQESKIKDLEEQLNTPQDINLNLDTPDSIKELEMQVLKRVNDAG